MRFNNLKDWLSWQESLNPKTIDLGLDRVQQVLTKLNLFSDFICPVITVSTDGITMFTIPNGWMPRRPKKPRTVLA